MPSKLLPGPEELMISTTVGVQSYHVVSSHLAGNRGTDRKPESKTGHYSIRENKTLFTSIIYF